MEQQAKGEAFIPEGQELLRCTIDKETGEVLRLKAALRGITVGALVDELVRHSYSRDKLLEDWANSIPPGR